MRLYKYILSFILFFSIVPTINAINASSCDKKELKNLTKIANYIKVNYEVDDNSENKVLSDGKNSTEYKIPKFNFKISIYNVAPELKVIVKNNINKVTLNITNDMTTDGLYTFSNDDFGRIYNYTFEVYGKDCNNKIRTLKLTKPRYNAYSEFTFCQNSSIFYCQKFVGSETGLKSAEDFLKKIEANNKKPVIEGAVETVRDLIKNNWKIYIAVFAIVVVLFVALIVLLRHLNKKKGTTL